MYVFPSFTRNVNLFSPPAENKLNDVINYIENEYVDTLSRNLLTEKAIQGMLQSLDPHSLYIPAEEFNDANDPLMGNFDGIGIQFRVIRDTITVINTIAGGPSEEKGILAGDRIVKIDSKNVARIKIKDVEVMKLLKGKRGTTVTVSVFRKGKAGLTNYEIVRNVIPTYSVDIAYMVNNETGYIKLSKFSASTYEELVGAIANLQKKGLRKLVLDLRGNGGGLLDAAVKVADEFIDNRKLIVYTEGAHRKKQNFYAKYKGLFENQELVVLIDEFSASASEIVAGAIQDNDRGLIIGRRSFGKGLVQEQIQLSDGSAVRLTVARYHTPTGRCIQKPYSGNVEEYYEEFYFRLLEEDVSMVDSLNFSDTIKYKTPKGKIVYGGGGIMPDIYIAHKSEFVSAYYRKITNKNLINDFCFDYADQNRLILKSYGTPQRFISSFEVSQELFRKFVNYVASNGITADEKEIKDSENQIKTLLKAFIGRNIFDDEVFYPVLNSTDLVFEKAINVLNP